MKTFILSLILITTSLRAGEIAIPLSESELLQQIHEAEENVFNGNMYYESLDIRIRRLMIILRTSGNIPLEGNEPCYQKLERLKFARKLALETLHKYNQIFCNLTDQYIALTKKDPPPKDSTDDSTKQTFKTSSAGITDKKPSTEAFLLKQASQNCLAPVTFSDPDDLLIIKVAISKKRPTAPCP